MRLFHAAMLASVFLYIALVEFFLRPTPREPNMVFVGTFLAVSITSCFVALFFRKSYVEASVEALRSNPEDAAAVRRWRLGVVVSVALAESVVLFGFVLRMIGTPVQYCAVFYVLAVLMMVILTPQRP